jgi:hypothetical protein
MKMKLALLLAVAVLLGGLGIAYRHWSSSPSYSLRQIQQALETHDVVKFEKYVDVETVSSRLIDDVMTQVETRDESPATGLATGLVQLMKPRLVDAIQEQVTRLIETGNFAGSSDTAASGDLGNVSLEQMSDQIGAREDSYNGVAYTRSQGKIALLGLEFHNSALDTTMVLELKMRAHDGYWQLVELVNLIELIEKAQALEAALLDKLNEPIRREISDVLRVDITKKTNDTDRWGISKQVTLGISVRNISSRTVAGYSAVIDVLDLTTGIHLKEVLVHYDEHIAPSANGFGAWTMDVNMFDKSASRIYELPTKSVRLEVSFNRIVFDDGSEVKLFTSLDDVMRED